MPNNNNSFDDLAHYFFASISFNQLINKTYKTNNIRDMFSMANQLFGMVSKLKRKANIEKGKKKKRKKIIHLV